MPRRFASASNNTVGLISHDVGDPFFAAIAAGVMRAAAEKNLLVMLASAFREPARETAYVATLRAQRARAILLMGFGFQDRTWERALAAELEPYVRASRTRRGRQPAPQPTGRATSCRRTGAAPRPWPGRCSTWGTGAARYSPDRPR
ncbi:hypothetical protein SHIRM173S_06470 [Streptomyces hirsutus]